MELPDGASSSVNNVQEANGIQKYMGNIDRALRKFFYKLGYFVTGRPILVIAINFILCAATLFGMFRFEREKRPQKAYLPSESVINYNLDYIRENFGPSPRFTNFICTGKEDQVNLASRRAFLECLNAARIGYETIIENPTTSNNLSFSENCFKTQDTQGNVLCATNSPFDLFYNADKVVLKNDSTVDYFSTVKKAIEGMSDIEFRRKLLNGPFISVSGTPFEIIDIISFSDSKDDLFITSLLHSQFSKSKIEVKNGMELDRENDALEKAWAENILNADLIDSEEEIEWFVQSTYSEIQVFDKSITEDIYLFIIGVGFLSLIVLIFLGDFHVVRSRIILGCAGLMTAGLAYVAAVGLGSAFGIFYGPVHEILPLILFAIGVDDVFVLTKSLDTVNYDENFIGETPRKRVSVALSHGGTAITVTSLTNVIVFCLSAVSDVPALKFFALSTAIGVFFAWILSLTFFTAALVLDCYRQDANRKDITPWKKIPEDRDPRNEVNIFGRSHGSLRRFLRNQYGPFLVSTTIRYAVIVVFALLLGIGIWGTTQLKLNWSMSLLYVDGSNQEKYQKTFEQNFRLGFVTHAYVSKIDLSTTENQRNYFNLCHPESGSVAKIEMIANNSIDCWFTEFIKFSSKDASEEYVKPSQFDGEVKRFLRSQQGFRYINDVAFENGKVVGSRFYLRKILTSNTYEELDARNSLAETLEKSGFGYDEEGNPKAFAFSYEDIFTDAVGRLPREITISLTLALTAVGLVCILLIGHPFMALLSVLLVAMVVIDILGVISLTKINLNAVSLLSVVVATGLSIDYIIHVARSFLEQLGSRKERSVQALEAMGPAVIYSGFSTLSAILILLFAKAYPFKVIFVGFSTLILLGLAHGPVLGPVIYSFIGPTSLFNSEDEKLNTELSLLKDLDKESK